MTRAYGWVVVGVGMVVTCVGVGAMFVPHECRVVRLNAGCPETKPDAPRAAPNPNHTIAIPHIVRVTVL